MVTIQPENEEVLRTLVEALIKAMEISDVDHELLADYTVSLFLNNSDSLENLKTTISTSVADIIPQDIASVLTNTLFSIVFDSNGEFQKAQIENTIKGGIQFNRGNDQQEQKNIPSEIQTPSIQPESKQHEQYTEQTINNQQPEHVQAQEPVQQQQQQQQPIQQEYHQPIQQQAPINPEDICKSYSQRGYCARGLKCNFRHYPEPIAVNKFPEITYYLFRKHKQQEERHRYRLQKIQRATHSKNNFNQSSYKQSENVAPNSIIITNIPDEKLSIDQINEFFKVYGSISNIHVDSYNHKATVQFGTEGEAQSAYSSPNAVFGDSNVKVTLPRMKQSLNAATRAASESINTPQPIALNAMSDEQKLKREEVLRKAAENLAKLEDEKQRQKVASSVETVEQVVRRQMDEQKKLFSQIQDPNLSSSEKLSLMKRAEILATSIRTGVESIEKLKTGSS